MAIDCRVYRSTTQACTTALLTKMSYDTVRWDNGGFWAAGSPTRLTIPQSGLYLCGSHVDWASGSSTKSRYTDIYLNNTTIIAEGSGGFATVSTEDGECEIATIWRFVAGDYIEVRGYQNSGGNLNVTASSASVANANEFWAVRLGS